MYISAWATIGKNPIENWETKKHLISTAAKPVCFFHTLWWGLGHCDSEESCTSIWKSSSSKPGGDNGGTANGWEGSSVNSKTLLAVAWESLSLPIFLEVIAPDVDSLEELLLSTDDKNWSFERFVCAADEITELKTPDSLNPRMMTWNRMKSSQESNLTAIVSSHN